MALLVGFSATVHAQDLLGPLPIRDQFLLNNGASAPWHQAKRVARKIDQWTLVFGFGQMEFFSKTAEWIVAIELQSEIFVGRVSHLVRRNN